MSEPNYSPAIARLLVDDRVFALGPGRPNDAAYASLRGLTAEKLFAPHPLVDRDAAQACLAGLWLYHDYLDESHRISQDLDTSEGSYWHAIMHRREPDYWNSKYWFRRVGGHPIFARLHEAADSILREQPASGLAEMLARGPWDPFAFVDACAAACGPKAPWEPACRRIQRCEWDLLFAYCVRRALGS